MHFNVWAVSFFLIAGSAHSNAFPSIARVEYPTSDLSALPAPQNRASTTAKPRHIQGDIPQPSLLDSTDLKSMARAAPVAALQPSVEYLPPAEEAVNEAPESYRPKENPTNPLNLKPQAAIQVEVHAQVAGVHVPEKADKSQESLAVAPSVVDTQQVGNPNQNYVPPAKEPSTKVEAPALSYLPPIVAPNAVEALSNGIITADAPAQSYLPPQ